MPNRQPRKEDSDDRWRPDERRFAGSGIRFGKIREKPCGKQKREKDRKRRQTGDVRHGEHAREPQEQRFGERASEIERLTDQKDGSAVQQASEKRHGMSGLSIIANVQQYERRGMDRNGRRSEDRELLPIGKQIPIRSEIQNEPDAYERRPYDRKDRDEFRGRGFFGFQTVMGQQPFGLRIGHDSRLDERRHVGGKLLVKV